MRKPDEINQKIAVIEIVGEHGTEGEESGKQIVAKKICSGMPILAMMA